MSSIPDALKDQLAKNRLLPRSDYSPALDVVRWTWRDMGLFVVLVPQFRCGGDGCGVYVRVEWLAH